ncbi:MAG: glycosyltransferase [Nonlabens sp.]|uniref:glycosyltransferase n=1 Tax=Nonlabens sp. TaxID=1888209 RepID=UPI003EFB260F
MNPQPDILSVVIPVYNGGEYLKEAIDSVLSQTYKEFELIILNDGSTDNSEEIILSYDDSRIVYVKHENIGLSKTLNKGIQLAKGVYIARMDADDVCLPTRFEKQIEYLLKNPETVLLGGGIIRMDKDGKELAYDIPYIGSSVIKKVLLNKGNAFKHPTVIFKKDVAIELGGYDEEINCFFEDYYLWSKMVNRGLIVNNLKIPVLKYRITPGSIMSSGHNEEFIKMTIRVANTEKFSDEDMSLISQKKNDNKAKETAALYEQRMQGEKNSTRARVLNSIASVIGINNTFKLFSNLKYLISQTR